MRLKADKRRRKKRQKNGDNETVEKEEQNEVSKTSEEEAIHGGLRDMSNFSEGMEMGEEAGMTTV